MTQSFHRGACFANYWTCILPTQQDEQLTEI